MTGTQIKVLEAAEAEFAEHGFAGASIRNITQRAGVNVASIHYHFGSKEELIKQLLLYRIAPVNELRLSRLAEEQAKYPDGVVPVAMLVDVMVRPALEKILSPDGALFIRAMARCMSEPFAGMDDIDREVFSEMFSTFCRAFSKSLPHLDESAVIAQMNFVVCSMVGMMMHFPRIENLHGTAITDDKYKHMLESFIHFVAAGVEGAGNV